MELKNATLATVLAVLLISGSVGPAKMEGLKSIKVPGVGFKPTIPTAEPDKRTFKEKLAAFEKQPQKKEPIGTPQPQPKKPVGATEGAKMPPVLKSKEPQPSAPPEPKSTVPKPSAPATNLGKQKFEERRAKLGEGFIIAPLHRFGMPFVTPEGVRKQHALESRKPPVLEAPKPLGEVHKPPILAPKAKPLPIEPIVKAVIVPLKPAGGAAKPGGVSKLKDKFEVIGLEPEKSKILGPPTSFQSKHPGHHINFNFTAGAKFVDGIPICTPGAFEKGKLLRETAVSTVYIAKHKSTNSIAIRKDVYVDNLREFETQNRVAEETGVAPRIYCIEYNAKDHISLYQERFKPENRTATLKELNIKDPAKPVTVYMEYCCGGTWFNAMGVWNGNSRPHHNLIRKWVTQAYNIINAVHKLNILHLDIKLENFVLNCRGDLKLIDFGHAETRKDSLVLSIVKGTTHYIAPEVRGFRADFYSDYYSFGIMLTEVFEQFTEFDSLKDIEFKQVPESLQGPILRLTGPISDRISAWSTLLKNPFFTST